jgi:hypothetical protein
MQSSHSVSEAGLEFKTCVKPIRIHYAKTAFVAGVVNGKEQAEHS